MTYNKRYYYLRIIEVQEIVTLHKKKGITQIYIYKQHIEKQYNISYSTYNLWLSIPAKRDLKRLEEQAK